MMTMHDVVVAQRRKQVVLEPGNWEFTVTDADLYGLLAAGRPGGASRGNLAVLIRYWTFGKGRAKIGWGSPGDFNRCVARLSKYVPPGQVKGFCAKLHKRATGQWPGRGRSH